MLSVLILAKNEEDVIEDCIKSIKDIADEIIVVDSYSTDKTVKIVEKFGAKVVQNRFVDFSDQRNFAFHLARGEWVLYLDSDEKATEDFKEEAYDTIGHFREDTGVGGFYVRRKTFFYGRDWGYTDKVQRLFYKKFFVRWEGKLHETPNIIGTFSQLQSSILHFTHRDLYRMVEKTNEWSEIEAELRYKAHHPKMSWWRFIRVMLSGFMRSYILEKGYKNGTYGFIESMYQAFSLFITYAKLWEKQVSTSSSL